MAAWRCLRFCPTDQAIFQVFLNPKIALAQGDQLADSLILEFEGKFYNNDPLAYVHPPNHYFPLNQYWYFVRRVQSRPTSLKPNRAVVHGVGTWRKTGRTVIVVGGGLDLGSKSTFDYLNSENLRTGWRVIEYERAVEVPTFEPWVVVNMCYEAARDQRVALQIHQNLLNQNQNEGENQNEDENEGENQNGWEGYVNWEEVENDVGENVGTVAGNSINLISANKFQTHLQTTHLSLKLFKQ